VYIALASLQLFVSSCAYRALRKPVPFSLDGRQ
jgi:hypothetical protein